MPKLPKIAESERWEPAMNDGCSVSNLDFWSNFFWGNRRFWQLSDPYKSVLSIYQWVGWDYVQKLQGALALCQMNVRLRFLGRDSFRQASAVVLNEAVLPFEKIRDGLRLNAHFYATQAGEQKIHLPHEAGLAALAFAAGLDGNADFTAFAFKQSPLGWKLVHGDQPLRREIKTFTAHGELGILAERLFAIGKEVGAGDFALDYHGAARALPANDVGRLAAGAGLFREDDAATISGTKPLLGEADEDCMGHGYVVAQR